MGIDFWGIRAVPSMSSVGVLAKVLPTLLVAIWTVWAMPGFYAALCKCCMAIGLWCCKKGFVSKGASAMRAFLVGRSVC